MSPKESTPLMEAWAKELARQMLEPRDGDSSESVLLRVAIALVQARAKEARHLAGAFTIKSTDPHNPLWEFHRSLARHLTDREHLLEQFALDMAGFKEETAIELPGMLQ